MATSICSFGIKHHPQGASWPWGARTCIDVRHFANPYARRAVLTTPFLIGRYIEQYTPDFDRLYAELLTRVNLAPGVVCLYCTGGQHRSVYLANRIAQDLGLPPATHLDLEE